MFSYCLKTCKGGSKAISLLLIGLIAFPLLVQGQHQPDDSRLDSKARRSTQLYVSPGFNFATHKNLVLDISALSDTGVPYNNAMVFVFSVPKGVTELDDEKLGDKSLLSILKTDANGKIYQEIEVAQKVDNLLVEIRVVGINNRVLASSEHSDVLEIYF